ncbi:MAG: aminoacyl-tRNA hydrolase [Leptospiraceae bacterium]|nr:aminoacyl-tRNA hydrolase [Leptospiraceae bacterium]MDW7975398.1 aminoacyl-tRNA hydrolase [Leptospiraceae bacterium]
MNQFLIVGLGNPGIQYKLTRHNAGFIFLDMWINELFPHAVWKEKYLGHYFEANLHEAQIQFLKPQTYMNLSGNAVCKCIKEENLPLDRVLVLHDEIELPFREVRWKEGGGHRGHNGLRDIIQKCGDKFNRIRIGVGRPHDPSISVADYLLSPFTTDEQKDFPIIYQKVKELLEKFIKKISISSM